MEIKPVESGVQEAEAILALQKIAYQSEAEIYNDFSIQPLRQTLEELKKEYKEKKVLKVEIDGKILGSVRAYQKGDTCFVEKLIVHPAFQNKGIGASLLIAVEKFFPAAERFELFTGSKSEKNLHLYFKNGYTTLRQEKIKANLTLSYLEKGRTS